MPHRHSSSDDIEIGDGGKSNGGACGFYINKGGLPVDDFTWERMWDHVMKMYPDGADKLNAIRNARNLPEVGTSVSLVMLNDLKFVP